jgi:hypothetical protein
MSRHEWVPSRTEILLALILLSNMKHTSLATKINTLNLAGFSNVEIANILEITPEQVVEKLYNLYLDPKKQK